MFSNESINLEILKERAYNLRWATQQEGIIPLTAADPDFPCAPEISEAIQKYARDRYFSYTPVEGIPKFREAVARYYLNKRQVEVHPKNVLAVNSAAYGLYVVCKTILSMGDEAIVFNPCDFLFAHSVKAANGTVVPFSIPLNPNENLDINALKSLINKQTKLICICNPINPTGRVLNSYELKQIGEIAVAHNLIILSDEIWSDIVFEPFIYKSIASISESIKNQTIIVTGYSKSYGLAGLRVGSVIAPNEALFTKILNESEHNSTVNGCNVLAQVAVISALNECDYWLTSFIEHLSKMRNLCVNELNLIKGIHCNSPQGCYLAFPNISETGLNESQVHQLLLEKAKVAVVPGLSKWFGERAEGHIRLSFATSEKILTEALQRIQFTFNEL